MRYTTIRSLLTSNEEVMGIMDFANRGTRPVGSDSVTPGVLSTGTSNKSPKSGSTKLTRILMVTLLFSGTLLAIALIIFVVFGRTPSEDGYVEKTHYQAVFLNGGQVYFGKIGKFNDKYLTLSDIFYLRVNQPAGGSTAASSNDVSLAKLGSELHGPEDQMVINRDQVQFWENLKNDGQVVKAITTYKANPNAANNTPTGAGTATTPEAAPTTPAPTTKKP